MMFITRFIVMALTSLVLSGGRVCDEPTEVAVEKIAAKPPSPQAVEWLDKLESRGKDIRFLKASVVYNKTDVLLQDEVTRTGLVQYAAANDTGKTPAKFAVLFKQLVVDGTVHNQLLEYLFDGQSIVEKDYNQKTFIKRQVVAPNDKEAVDPLAIDGPFPLPLGQKRGQVLDRFEVAVAQDSTEELLHLELRPRPDAPASRNRKHFDRVDFWFDKKTLLPLKVTTDEGSSKTTVSLSNVKLNGTAEADYGKLFSPDPPPPGEWRVEIKPWRAD